MAMCKVSAFRRLPEDLDCVRFVESFEELVAAPMEGKINAICWRRKLEGDYDAIMATIGDLDEITGLEEDDLDSLELGPHGSLARRQLIQDLSLLRGAGLEPSLDCIPSYPRSSAEGPIPVDVYDFHADSATVLTDTYLCSYTVACSEGIRNEDAIRYIDIPEIRGKVLREYGGADDSGFLNYLRERFYDLHYKAIEGRPIFSFGLGNMWRVATQCPGRFVSPCIHRAPTTSVRDPARLLLIS